MCWYREIGTPMVTAGLHGNHRTHPLGLFSIFTVRRSDCGVPGLKRGENNVQLAACYCPPHYLIKIGMQITDALEWVQQWYEGYVSWPKYWNNVTQKVTIFPGIKSIWLETMLNSEYHFKIIYSKLLSSENSWDLARVQETSWDFLRSHWNLSLSTAYRMKSAYLVISK